MIRIPSSWRAAQYPCAFVELRGGCYVCCVVPVATAALSYKVETAVRVGLEEARRFASQDFASAETHDVTIAACSDGVVYSPLSTSETAVRNEENEAQRSANGDALVLRCPLFRYLAKEVTVEGTRGDVRGTAAHLTAALMGRYVIAGAQFRTEEGVYTVRHVSLHKRYRGIALVSGDCRVRVNEVQRHTPGLTSSGRISANTTQCAPNSPIGLDEEVRQLRQFIACADQNPGSFTGVVVRGPRGCGVSSTVHYVLNTSCVRHQVLTWSAQFSATKAAHGGRGGTCVLMVPHAEHVFAEAELELAKLHLCKLQRDAAGLRDGVGNGQRVSVVVLCISHAYGLCASNVLDGLFSFHIVFSFPNARQRALLLASVRGGAAEDWQGAAQCLVGRTSAETLAAARQPSIAATLPFKAVPWAQIGGLAEVKSRLHRALVWPQQQPDLMRRFNITPPRGILLYGPPGCAKTTLIKALCTEGNFSLIYLDSATVVSAYVGESERCLRDVFARARRQAPCIVFFDEVEVLGGRRAVGGRDGEHVRLLSTLLTEMDGFADTCGVCFVGATNVPHLLDPALMRPGRFDYVLYVPLPGLADRVAILELLLRKTAANAAQIAERTAGFSGADLKVFCSEALLALFKESAQVPAILAAEETVTAYLLERAAAFQRTHYDSTALDQFRREHAAA
ncbi:putative ATPase [Leptomonas pyrrhocoris]|uniref:Putative ATPase n=1 Tax=Leptomonas pyrrhocoris TaxID=157538 RepID=A0A0N0DR23_LEPPY|nr:putative ATPase [Leptomonas pyrrhocoris]KPA73504.1 putative ATPase [Leptomonas pyrrhocoris]|eukprot:XP_015651943.1 putative ATPase [Leptomonas pyrrhocoris]